MNKILRRIRQIYILIKYYIVLIISFFIIENKEIWLLSERGDEARDNSYALYKYLKEKQNKIIVKFVITKNSVDIHKINKEDIVYYQSIKHIYYYIKAKYLISTHIQGYSPEFRLFSRLAKYNIFYKKGKEIMLQHGITKNPIDNLFYNNNKELSLFICGASPEYNYIKKTFGYNEKVVKYTGFARFDTLITENEGNKILLMPTWRTFLFGITKSEFKKSEYFTFYNNLINDKKLLTVLKKKNINLIFYPHYEIQKYLDCFKKNNQIIIANKEKYDVQELLRKCDLLITDYSSVYFDFAYMRKPVIYSQFDKNKFEEEHYKKGYFDYEKDGFGPVVTSYEQVIETIIKYIENNFKNESKYIKKSKKFYKYNDSNNSERIYKEINKLEKE